MNEDGTPIVDTSNTGEEAQESTTPEEVADILGLNKPETVTEEELIAAEEATPAEGEPVEPEAPAAGEPVAAEEATPEAPAAETPAEPVEAPSFALEVEDVNGEKVTINPGDNLEEVLKDFEPKTNGQIFQIIKDVMDMESAKKEYDTEQETKAGEAAHAETLANIHAGWDKEMAALQAEKRLPVSADPNNPNKEFVERRGAVFRFMAEENSNRQKDGRPLLQSFGDALDKLENREAKEAKVEADKKERELAKKRGSMVGGSSAAATSSAPVYRPGSARTADEALRSMGMLG